jgi:hypothetical protein
MAIWRKFANGETSQPGTIANKLLAEKINYMRAKSKFCIHDNSVKLREPEDFYLLS